MRVVSPFLLMVERIYFSKRTRNVSVDLHVYISKNTFGTLPRDVLMVVICSNLVPILTFYVSLGIYIHKATGIVIRRSNLVVGNYLSSWSLYVKSLCGYYVPTTSVMTISKIGFAIRTDSKNRTFSISLCHPVKIHT